MPSPLGSNLPLSHAIEDTLVHERQAFHPFLSKNVGEEVSIHCLDLYQYSCEKIYTCLDWVRNFHVHLTNVCETHCIDLLEPICKMGYDCSNGQTTIIFTASVNLSGETAGGTTT